MNIIKIKLSHLRNDEHFELFTEYDEQVVSIDVEKLKVMPLYGEFKTAMSLEDAALKKISKSVYTDRIIEADKVRDRNFRGLADNSRAMLNHFKPEVLTAAKQVQIIFDSYGNIAGKGMSEKGSAYTNLIQELNVDRNMEAVKLLGLDGWLAELAANNKEVFQLVKQRTQEAADRTDVVMKEARERVDAAYHAINKRVLALLEVEGGIYMDEVDIYEKYIRTVNVIVERYNNTVASRRGRGSNNATETKE